MPVMLVRGEHANPVMKEITNVLGHCLPNSQTHIVDKASHFLTATHSKECAELLSTFLSKEFPPI
ncbi:hypothetical protein [Shimia sp.]|uniref:alpha/beta fold hydrolase n=1 Tax=Shimia sp. TaxID=1954381 RepID=UPI00329A0B1D